MKRSQLSTIIRIDEESLRVLAVGVLERLGYMVKSAPTKLAHIVAGDRSEERHGPDVWRQDYRIVLQWDPVTDQTVTTNHCDRTQVTVEVTEQTGTATDAECLQRCDDILAALEQAAQRAQTVAARKQPSTAFGAARWGTEAELRQKNYITARPDPASLILGRTAGGEYIAVPEKQTNAHALVVGRTGIGKSTGFFIPNLIERLGANMIVTEATPDYEPSDLYQRTAGWRRQAGHAIYSFNPADPTSTRINPIDRVRYADAQTKTLIAELISTLIIVNGSGRSEGRSENPIWNNMEQLLLYSLILHAAACEPELGHMGAIRWLLLSGMQQTRKVLQNSPSRLAQMEFEGWLSTTKAEEFRYSILGGLMAKLNPWKTDEIVAITSTTDLDLAGLRDQLFTFYLAVPINWHASKLVGALIFNFLVGYLLQHRRQIKRPIALMLDEFTHFGKIPDITALLGIVRKAGIGMVLGFQNVNQLDDVYNSAEARTIVDMPATQIFFRSKNFREARDLSDSLGRTTVEQSTVTDSGRVQESVMGRALATPEELLNLDREVIVFTADTWPVKTALTAPDAYSLAAQYPPPERPPQPVSDFIRRRGREAREDQKTFEQTVADKTKASEKDDTDPTRPRRRDREPADPGNVTSNRPGAAGSGDNSQGTARGGGTRRPPKSRNAPDSRLF